MPVDGKDPFNEFRNPRFSGLVHDSPTSSVSSETARSQPDYVQQRKGSPQRKYFNSLPIDRPAPFEQGPQKPQHLNPCDIQQENSTHPSNKLPLPAEYRENYMHNLAEIQSPSHTREDMLTTAEMEKRRLQEEPPYFQSPKESPGSQIQDSASQVRHGIITM